MRFIAIFMLFGALASCGDPDGWQRGDEGRYEYRILRSSGGAGIDFGDEVQLNYAIFRGDSLLETNAEAALTLTIPARQYRNAWESGIMQARAGDSLVIRAKMREVSATMERFSSLFAPDDWVICRFGIRSVRPRAELERAQAELQQQTQGFSSIAAMETELKALSPISDSLQTNMERWYFDISQGQNIGAQTDSLMTFQYLPPAQGFELLGEGQIPQIGDSLTIYYATMVAQGQQIYDNALARRARFGFALGEAPQIIRGFHEAARRLKVGQRGYFLLAPNLAYGEAGSPPVIPPNSHIVLYMHLLARQPRR